MKRSSVIRSVLCLTALIVTMSCQHDRIGPQPPQNFSPEFDAARELWKTEQFYRGLNFTYPKECPKTD
jgi:hypothetical protein